MNSRELRTLLQTNSTGIEYSSIKTILNKVFGQNTYFEDPLNELYDGLKSSVTFSFPDSCINDINVNFRSNELNLLSLGHSPLYLPISFLTHDDLLPSKRIDKTEDRKSLIELLSSS